MLSTAYTKFKVIHASWFMYSVAAQQGGPTPSNQEFWLIILIMMMKMILV